MTLYVKIAPTAHFCMPLVFALFFVNFQQGREQRPWDLMAYSRFLRKPEVMLILPQAF